MVGFAGQLGRFAGCRVLDLGQVEASEMMHKLKGIHMI
jgi:hypothetical protein